MSSTKQSRRQVEDVLRNNGFKYITRAAHGEVNAHRTTPKRMLNFWDSKGRVVVDNLMYNDLTWNDEPLYIGKEKNKCY